MGLFDSLEALRRSERKIKRRRFLALLGLGGAGLWGYRWALRRPQRLRQLKSNFITPNDRFYTVAKNPSFSPKVSLDEWRLELKGLDGATAGLSYKDLKALPSRVVLKTFECISNSVGGDAIGNAEWRVVSLPRLLERVLTDHRHGLRVVFYALDGFYSSVPLELALAGGSYVAYEMNGVPLPKKHGYPARAIIPGLYGMKQPKWLQRIEVTDEPVSGYWERQGWSNTAVVMIMSRIDAATQIAGVKGTEVIISGVAYAGREAVQQVEINLDDGTGWQPTELMTKPQSDVWSLWRFVWRGPRPGHYTLSCRAMDATGRRQIEAGSITFPSGATGLHRVQFDVG